MPYPLPLTRTEAYLAYKAGVIQQSDLKPSLAVPRNGIDAWLAYWTGLAADYPKREDGTPHILQEEEAYIAYLCGVVSEYPEKCLRRVGAYLRYLISARWGRPDHPLNREELYLSLIKTQFIPSGDPSSDITIDGTAKAPFVDVKMYGDTFQQSYDGKNLFDKDKALDNYFYTATGSKSTYSKAQFYNNKFVSTGDKITMSFSAANDKQNGSDIEANVRIVQYDASGNFISRLMSRTNGYTFTLDANTKSFILCVDNGSDAWFDDLQVEYGSTATSYEPYVGGIPAPNPEYPQTVQTVTGTQTVEVVGKNLFDKNHPNDSKCYVNNSGVLTSGDKQNLSVYIKCEPNTTYTVSKSNKGTNNRLCVFDTETEPAIGVSVISTVGTRVGEDNSPSYTITTGANAHYLGVFYRAAATTPSESEIKDTIQIEKGSTATAYEPYISNDYEINLGKNLFNRNDVVNGIPSASDGSIISTSSAGRTSDYIPVMANTSYSHTGHSAGWATITWYKADKSFIQRVDNITTTTSPSGAAYARVSCAQSNLGTCQFEAGEPTNYAPYFTPIELCKIGTYQDYIYKDSGDWKIHRAINKKKMSSFNWERYIQAEQTRFRVLSVNIPSSSSRADYVVSEYFHYDSSANQVGVCFAYNSQIWIIFADGTTTTLEDFSNWIRDNDPYLWHVYATPPTDTIITNQALVDQLEALVKGGSEEGTTYIKLSTPEPNLPGLLYVEAAKYV